jgi:hypothetical protein
MTTDDSRLDRMSRSLMEKLERLRFLERQKRGLPRSTPQFHHLADEIESVAEGVWHAAVAEEIAGRQDSPIPAERAEQEPGDWTHQRDN